MDDHEIATRLADEFERLIADPLTAPAFQVAAPPFEAYTLVATLQFASRNPELSDTQRRIIVSFARQLAGLLIAQARRVVGPWSAIETTVEMGFDPAYDRPPDERRGS